MISPNAFCEKNESNIDRDNFQINSILLPLGEGLVVGWESNKHAVIRPRLDKLIYALRYWAYTLRMLTRLWTLFVMVYNPLTLVSSCIIEEVEYGHQDIQNITTLQYIEHEFLQKQETCDKTDDKSNCNYDILKHRILFTHFKNRS